MMTFDASDVTQKQILDALEAPSDFGYFGDIPLFETWGLCGPSQHRDSDPLGASNCRVILKDLQERFPDDIEVIGSSHWAVGWIDQIAVRVIDDNGEPTEAFAATLEWADRLEGYPVADETDYSELEHEDLLETLEHGWWPKTIEQTDGKTYELTAPSYEDLARALYDFDVSRGEDVSEQNYIDAHIENGWLTLEED